MRKTKDPVCDQVNMEMLADEFLLAAPNEQDHQHHRIENNFRRHCRPAWDACCIRHCKPRWFTDAPWATTVCPATDPAQDNPQRRDSSKPVAGDVCIAENVFAR